MKSCKQSKLYIIGNGFDIMHNMGTRYEHFNQWRIGEGRIDIIQEFQSVFKTKHNDDFLLWSDFEKALGEYNYPTALKWNFDSLYIVVGFEDGTKTISPDSIINVQLNNIINEIFPKWVRQISVAKEKQIDLEPEALYLTFNYTDTIETLYQIPDHNILHIHGRASANERLIVGHNKFRDTLACWSDNISLRENNERVQNIANMNNLCKPISEIIERNCAFFSMLKHVDEVEVIGHSCAPVDFPYLRHVFNCTPPTTLWRFNPYSDEDTDKIKHLIGLLNLHHVIIKQIT